MSYCCGKFVPLVADEAIEGLYLTCSRGCHVISVRGSRFLKASPGSRGTVWLVDASGRRRRHILRETHDTVTRKTSSATWVSTAAFVLLALVIATVMKASNHRTVAPYFHLHGPDGHTYPYPVQPMPTSSYGYFHVSTNFTAASSKNFPIGMHPWKKRQVVVTPA